MSKLAEGNIKTMSRDSSVSIATCYGLGGTGIESRLGARFSAPFQINRGAHPASYTMGTRSLPRVKSGRGVTPTPNSLLVPWSWKGIAIPLLPLLAVRPVQSLSDCTGVSFTLFYPQSFGISAFIPQLLHVSKRVRRPGVVESSSICLHYACILVCVSVDFVTFWKSAKCPKALFSEAQREENMRLTRTHVPLAEWKYYV